MSSSIQLPGATPVDGGLAPTSSIMPANKLPSALPALPDPTMLFQVSSSLASIKDEIMQGLSNIQSLREAVKSAGPDALPLPPLDESFLLPLPGPPQPSHRHRPVPQMSSKDTSSIIRPIERPRIPRTDFSSATLEEILERFRRTMAAEERLPFQIEQLGSSGTLKLSLGPVLGSGWVILDTDQAGSAGEQPVARVSIFGPSESKPSVLAVPAQAPFGSLSTHLTSLKLTLDELLYRLPHIAALLKEPCFRCKKYLRLGVGPSMTGMLPVSQDDDGEADIEMESNEGKWVIWHRTCSL